MRNIVILVAGAAIVWTGVAMAGEHRYDISPLYKEECGSCHVAYPPPLLSAGSWRAVMGGLNKHFGEDASIDPGKAKELSAWLAANAGRRDSTDGRGQSLLRISDTAWFRKEHRDGHDGLTPAVWRAKAVGSPANCGACHTDAERGDYSERGIRLPR
jgi:hypothetical protein